MFSRLKSECRAIPAAGVFVLLSTLQLAAAAATPCLYRGLDADARVINRSGEISAPFPASLSSNDCSRLRVANGVVVVYGVGADGAQLTSRQVSRGPLLPASDGSSPATADTAGILKQIVVVLEGVSRTKTGSSRSAEGDYLAASLPSGRLAQPVADLSLQLGPSPDANLGSFEVLVGGKSVQRQNGPAQWIKFPLSVLKPGANVRWKLEYSGTKYEGTFAVEPAGTMEALKQRLQNDSQGDTDEIVTQLRVASGLSAEGYAWDARELIRTALVP
ncbi:hypothetical protein DIC66_03915 [Rhodoferax lacus]|uniref:Uncharacterized protein n=1 Tax=Rhodoferax lacus TaxID=2184758 RepID=A0A3E1RFT6_9BURK|nr:hypothetical protein [Rhodoferax lacus]RFO97882.1 hypothetical protein DIC66_03915 [Rhodoferax lacus]